MKRSRFTDEQIIGILKEHAAGMTAQQLARIVATIEGLRQAHLRVCAEGLPLLLATKPVFGARALMPGLRYEQIEPR